MKQATDVFNDWAHRGKDEGMERGHGPSVREMLDAALERFLSEGDSFSFADLGCGNGWVVRLAQHEQCQKADGFDGAEHMIEKAKATDSTNGYHLALFPQTNLNNTISSIQWNSSITSRPETNASVDS